MARIKKWHINFSNPLMGSQCGMNYAEGMDSEHVYL